MMHADSLAAMRSVQLAATNLTLACTEIVGALPMEIAMPTVSALGEPLPKGLLRQLRAIDRERKSE